MPNRERSFSVDTVDLQAHEQPRGALVRLRQDVVQLLALYRRRMVAVYGFMDGGSLL